MSDSEKLIPSRVLEVLSGAVLPCFMYDATEARRRAESASSLLDRYFFPVKACPEEQIIRAALETGCGLDVCSAGDLAIAAGLNALDERCKFTSAHAETDVLRRLLEAGGTLDADSVEQALVWKDCGGNVCGLRVAPARPSGLYGAKFGMPALEVAGAATRLAAAGMRVEGLHVHDQHANLEPEQFSLRLAETLAEVDTGVLRDCRYVNIGGSWPMRYGNPVDVEKLSAAFRVLRARLVARGFKGALCGEPGRWVVGPCGYWAARVAAVKAHPRGEAHRTIVLDTSTPVPCRPSLSPFVVLREGAIQTAPRVLTCDIFGAANTALDCIGAEIRLPALLPGDVLVSMGQGAYTRQLIPPFNERDRPRAMVVSAA